MYTAPRSHQPVKLPTCLPSSPPVAAGEREIGRAKVRLQTQRDLDGIDSSNIITGGRQRRGGAAPVFYKAMIDLPSESEEEDEEESASEDDEQQSGSDAEAGGCAGRLPGEAPAPCSIQLLRVGSSLSWSLPEPLPTQLGQSLQHSSLFLSHISICRLGG